ncbi:MAG: HAMP domain-containing histidine kinase [Bacteriovorax sp.]|nr:HAMP domain-containing histidine kinase [Bacteriovorax sp.]
MKIKNFWKKSITRFAIFQITLLVILIAVFSLFGSYSRKSQADLLSSTVRNSFLTGDNRNVINSLSSTINNNFGLIVVYNIKGEEIFKIGDENARENFFTKVHTYEVLANLDFSQSSVGKIVYYYSLFIFLKNSILVWLIFLGVSLPFLIFEKRRLEQIHQDQLRHLKIETAKQITEQMSHDIRSPLAVLRNVIEDITNVSNIDLLILNHAITRIDEIAQDILETRDRDNLDNVKLININKILESIITDKKIQFKKLDNIEIVFSNYNEILFSEINSINFYRIISNIINNSVESIKEHGKVYIELTKLNNNALIFIKDNGKGIPEEILSRIGQRGFSFAKSGSGLGLSHAKNNIELWNGQLEVTSKLGSGTEIKISIPLKNDFTNALHIEDKDEYEYEYVYIDNDELLRLVWDEIAIKKKINLITLKSPAEFDINSKKFSKEFTKIYLDSDFGKDIIRGEDFAIMLHEEGYKYIFISTGYGPEKFSHLPWLKYAGKKCPL